MKRHNLVQFVFKSAFFQENKIYNFKIHSFSFLNTKQTNDCIFLNKTGENFNLAKIFWNVRVQLQLFLWILYIIVIVVVVVAIIIIFISFEFGKFVESYCSSKNI